MRSLAEQSRQATEQVRDILGEIQKAANTAVMVTEEGAKRADAGVGLAQTTGAGHPRYRREHQAGGSGGATDRGQRRRSNWPAWTRWPGRWTSINQATLQSEAGTRQVEEAARDLNALAGQLTAIVEQYRVA